MEKQKEQAVERFWHRQEFATLPPADESEHFRINSTVKVREDITNPSGDVLARAGDVVNPLEQAVEPRTYVVFDSRSEKQMRWLTDYLEGDEVRGRVMLIATRLSRDEGWEHLQELHNYLQQRVYMLQPQMIERFQLSASPAVIQTNLTDAVFEIQQVAL